MTRKMEKLSWLSAVRLNDLSYSVLPPAEVRRAEARSNRHERRRAAKVGDPERGRRLVDASGWQATSMAWED